MAGDFNNSNGSPINVVVYVNDYFFFQRNGNDVGGGGGGGGGGGIVGDIFCHNLRQK